MIAETLPFGTGASWLFISDVDDTLLGDAGALRALNRALAQAAGSLVVAYNSSRPCDSIRRSIEENRDLLVPDYLIGALGTEIENGRTGQPLAGYRSYVDHQWQRDQVVALAEELGFVPHAAEYQTPLKASFNVSSSRAYDEILLRLENAALEAKVIFSGGKNLDLIPTRAGKGNACLFLGELLAIDPSSIVVAGDSRNDVEMFVAPRKGIIVANANEDLKRLQSDHTYLASAAFAGGVLEGLQHWGALSY